MDKKKKINFQAEPKNYFCVWCLAFDGEWVDASYLFLNEDDNKVMPLCEDHKEMMEEEKHFFTTFSVN